MTGGGLPGPAMLFCPGDRPDRFAKAAARADVVILDLEDGVAPDAKPRARELVAEAASELDPSRTVVRVNAHGSPWATADLEALDPSPIRTVMLPKVSCAEDMTGMGRFNVIALCETAAGVLRAQEIAAAERCVGLLWGGEDLMADLGGRASRRADGSYHAVVQQARSTVLLAAAAQRRLAIDAVHIAIDDLSSLREEAAEAAQLGFGAKACIHPAHVALIRAAFRPSETEVRRAEALLDAARDAPDTGVFSFEGRMVDEPLLRHARAVVDAAQSTRDRHGPT